MEKKKYKTVIVDGIEVGKDIKEREQPTGRPLVVRIGFNLTEMLVKISEQVAEKVIDEMRAKIGKSKPPELPPGKDQP